MSAPGAFDVRRGAERFHTQTSWLDSRHSFSFGHHHDPANTGHGLLIVSNDDRVAPGGGFGSHSHRDMEIVTWVLEGELAHHDSTGTDGVIYVGLIQAMSAGTGIQHSEMNHSQVEPVHFVQMWVVPDTSGLEPGYQQLDVNERLDRGELVVAASGRGHEDALRLGQRGASMAVARLATGDKVTLPDSPFLHAFVARGRVAVGDEELQAGDALRLTDAGGFDVIAKEPSEMIVWDTDAKAHR